jgi:hypothetical protein
MRLAGLTPTIEDGEHEDAADGLLVVQVRRLRTISAEIPQPVTRESLIAQLAPTSFLQ